MATMDEMSLSERFAAAFLALCQMEARAEAAEAKVAACHCGADPIRWQVNPAIMFRVVSMLTLKQRELQVEKMGLRMPEKAPLLKADEHKPKKPEVTK